MPDRVSSRIAAAFAVVGLVAVLAVGADVRPEVGLYLIVGDRLIAADAAQTPLEAGSIPLGRDLPVGASVGGGLTTTDGARILYSATIVRREGSLAGPIAILLTPPDRAGADAGGDLPRVL